MGFGLAGLVIVALGIVGDLVVEDRPEHRVGVAKVVTGVFDVRERNGGDAPFALDHTHLADGLDLAIPAKPQGFARTHDVGKDNSHAARPCGFAEIQHTIGDQNDPVHILLCSRSVTESAPCPSRRQPGIPVFGSALHKRCY